MNQHSERALPARGRLAAIDYGSTRIGLAICDPSQTVASPWGTYTRRSAERDVDFFQELVETEEIVGFVLGLPVHMSGDESKKSRETRHFGRWLSEQTGLPIDYIDERYTTVQARESLRDFKGGANKRKQRLDKLAAQIILASYLERTPGRS